MVLKPSVRGRASASEFWYAAVFYFLVSLIASVCGGVLGFGVASTAVYLVLFVLGGELMFVAVRRYHDCGRSGVWIAVQALLNFVAVPAVEYAVLAGSNTIEQELSVFVVANALFLANTIWAIVWLSRAGATARNRYDS
jgi:uncharacterized membrane protein YhaH (DUF805 family)